MIGPRSRYLVETLTFTGRRLRVDGAGNPVRDDRGNDIYDETSYDVPQCSVEPRGTAPEYRDRSDQVVAGLTVYCQDPNCPVDEKDKLTWGGLDYEVDGPVERYTGARISTNNHSVIVLKRRTG